MKVTGYALREAIKIHDLQRSATASQFDGSLHAFEGESKDNPKDVVRMYLDSERAIAALQTAQAEYNLRVKVNVKNLEGKDESMTLSEAIKCIGGIARCEKMWRSAASPKSDKYSYRNDDLVRDAGQVRAQPTVTQREALGNATKMAKFAGAVRAAIATANATELDIESLNPQLLNVG